MTSADILILITDTDGLYSSDPSVAVAGSGDDQNSDAPKIIHDVPEITTAIVELAGEPKSNFGTGGMATKITAAKIAGDAGIPCAIVSGHDPNNLYRLFDGEEIGTFFHK